MANSTLTLQATQNKPIESENLFFFTKVKRGWNLILNLSSYNLKNHKISDHKNVEWQAWIFDLPKNDGLLLSYKRDDNKLFLSTLSGHEYKKPLVLWRSTFWDYYEVAYCDGYIYTFGYHTFRSKIIDESGNIIKKLNWIKMPHPSTYMKYSRHEYYSCAKYSYKMLITEARWDSIYIYDEIINSYSQLSVVLRIGCKVLTVHELNIYAITFAGPIYVNKGDLATWNILSLNLYDFDPYLMITSAYYENSFYIANNGNFYKFDFNKENLEKIEDGML